MDNLALHRIRRDIRVVKNDKLNELGIHIQKVNDFSVRALIIGPQDTPYEDGFYFFEIEFNDSYPFKPPRVLFKSNMDKIRFHPNLYVNGKVCISILNTWSGPQWTSCQSLKSVLLSLQSIFDDNPLKNEPGYEKSSIHHQIYFCIIKYENIRVCIHELLKTPPKGFEGFIPIIYNHFKERFYNIKNILAKIYELENFKSIMKCGVYGMQSKPDVNKLSEDLDIIYRTINNNVAETAYSCSVLS